MSNGHPQPLPQQIDHVHREILRRLAHADAAAERGIKFIEIWNGGGAIAMLSFWGAVPVVRDSCWTKVSLGAFLVGIFLTALVVVLEYEFSNRDYDQLNTNSGKYYQRAISWDEMWSFDANYRTSRGPFTMILGYAALLAAAIGTASGAVAALTQ